MKCLLVYEAGGRWFGSEVSWKRSGSGFYRETSGLTIPQTRDAIEAFAGEYGYSIEWRGPVPPRAAPIAPTVPASASPAAPST